MIDELHRCITRELASWQQQYSEVKDLNEAHRYIDLLSYVKTYYTYEDTPEYVGSEIASVLSSQRARTLQSIANALKDFTGQDFGTDGKAWKDWYAKNWNKVK